MIPINLILTEEETISLLDILDHYKFRLIASGYLGKALLEETENLKNKIAQQHQLSLNGYSIDKQIAVLHRTGGI